MWCRHRGTQKTHTQKKKKQFLKSHSFCDVLECCVTLGTKGPPQFVCLACQWQESATNHARVYGDSFVQLILTMAVHSERELEKGEQFCTLIDFQQQLQHSNALLKITIIIWQRKRKIIVILFLAKNVYEKYLYCKKSTSQGFHCHTLNTRGDEIRRAVLDFAKRSKWHWQGSVWNWKHQAGIFFYGFTTKAIESINLFWPLTIGFG